MQAWRRVRRHAARVPLKEDLQVCQAANMGRTKQTQLSILEAITEMDNEETPRIGYSTRVLTQTNLPYQNPKPGTEAWVRRNGSLRLVVKPATDSEGRVLGFPYGTMPRLLLTWMCREVVQNKSPVLELGSSLSAFMAELDLKDSGGKTGSRNRLREQLKRLMGATLTIHYEDGRPGHDANATIVVGRAMNVWWEPDGGSQSPTNGSTITLSRDFYDEVLAHPVPLNMKALQILRGSPLRLDIYAWLTYRLHDLERPLTIPWNVLRQQFGTAVSSDRRARYEFKRDFTGHLSTVLAVYHEAKVKPTDTGLQLLPSPPHVPFRGTYGLRRATKALKAAQQTRTQESQPALEGLIVPHARRVKEPQSPPANQGAAS